MYKDHMTLIHELKEYASPKARLTRMIQSGDVIQVRRGVFLDSTDHDYSLKSMASVIYGPSYISFEYALSHYGMIPERALAITSAVFNKNKNRRFHTPLGDFYYYYLPVEVYPYGIVREEENGQGYLIATREKALLDALYKVRGISTVTALSSLLFEDWRMDSETIQNLDHESIAFMAPLYRKTIMALLIDLLERGNSHA